MYISRLKSGDELNFKLKPGRAAWIQVIDGTLIINGKKVSAGDAASAENIDSIQISAVDKSEIILFDFA